MDSPKKCLLEFEQAIEYMDSMQVTDYLHKTLKFLKSNNKELCFPNISSYTEGFLVGLVTNLNSKSLNFNNKKFASEIIEVLELNRDVFRWTYTYENGNVTKNLLVYKKLYTNKIKMPADFKKPASSITQRLQPAPMLETKEGKEPSLSTASKTQVLNKTLRFIKNSTERVLHYPEMPLIQAQYIYSLLRNPKSNLSVGFGYKSMYAPLFEAMDVYGLDYKFRISFVETNNCETAGLKLEKIPRRNDSSKGDSSLNSSSSSTKSRNGRKRNKNKLPNGVTAEFMSDSLRRLLDFTGDAARASVTFDSLTDEEIGFIRGVKTLAGSPESYSMFDPQLRVSLKQLNCNIAEVMKTCKIRIEEEQNKKNRARFITLKKVPRELCPPVTPLRPITRSRSMASLNSGDSSVNTNKPTRKDGCVAKERSISKDRTTKDARGGRNNGSDSKNGLIQFKSGGKLILAKDQVDQTTDKLDQSTDKSDQTKDKLETTEGIEKQQDRLNKRKTKLLEDMSVPLESDKGMRMMKLMGWSGGALGTRGHGILEPIVPAIELPAGAGLGHVPPPKPETRALAAFRADLLHNLRELLTYHAEKQLEYRLPLSKKEKKFLNTALAGLNKREDLRLTLKIEVDIARQLLHEMCNDPELELSAEISHDSKKITLIKTKNPNQHLKRPKLKMVDKTTSITRTVLNTQAEYELINDEYINLIINEVIPTINTTCKTPVAVKARATRILFLGRFIDFVKGDKEEREFRFEGTLQRKMCAFLEEIVLSVNNRVRSGYVTQEELQWFNDLMWCSEGCLLGIEFFSKSRFIITKKKRQSMQYQKRFTNSARTHPDNNNDAQTDNQNHIDTDTSDKMKNGTQIELPASSIQQRLIDAAKEQVEVKEKIVDSKEKVEPLKEKPFDTTNQEKVDKQEIEFISKSERVEILDLYEDKENHEPTVIKGDEKELSDDKVKAENCDIEYKNNRVEVFKKESIEIKETETDVNLNGDDVAKLDMSELNKAVKDLELTIYETDLSLKVLEENNVSPGSKRSLTNSITETDSKKTKVTQIKNLLVISPRDPDKKINTEIVKKIQTRISAEIDNCEDFLPLLKCHGLQEEGLIYSCHDDNDVDWLKNVISTADLDLKISNNDDFCLEKKSRKFVIKINSFIPLDCGKVFSRIELYNNGLRTSEWRVLAEQTYSSYVLYIVEVDDKSFKYISREGFSLHIGLDKAQFSVIF